MGLTRQIARLRNKKENKKERRKVLLEPLEPRVLLSADLKFAMTGSADDVKLHLKEVDGVDTVQLIDMSDQCLLQSQALADTSAVIIEGSAARDMLTVDFTGPFSLPIFFTDDYSGDGDMLQVVGKANDWRIAGENQGNVEGPGPVSFMGIENLFGGADADRFIFDLGGKLGGLIDGGEGADTLLGADEANIWEILSLDSGSLNAQIFASIENLIGGADQDVFVLADMAGVTGAVDGGGGQDALDYSSYAVDVSVNLQTGESTGTAGIRNIENLKGGSGDDTVVGPDTDTTWNIEEIDAGQVAGIRFAGFENLKGGAGADLFVFADGAGITGMIEGGGGINTLDFSAYTTDVHVNLNAGTATGTGGISNIQNVIGGAGNDALTGDASPNILVGGAGNDHLSGGMGSDTLDGGEGTDTVAEARDADLIIKDTSLSVGTEVEDVLASIEKANLTGGASDNTMDASGFTGSAILSGGEGDDTFTLGLGTYAIDGGAGSDKLVAPNSSNSWEVTDLDAGTLNCNPFSSIENLIGGMLDDNFVLLAGGLATGLIDGRSGRDRLKGGDGANSWVLNALKTGLFNGKPFKDIEDFEGGAGEDTLYGPEADTTWQITGDGSGNVAGYEFFGMENLTGAADNEDTFVFESGGSLSGLIDGGDGGFDSIVTNGGIDTLVYSAAGPDAGRIDRDGDVIRYSGMEPLTNIGTADAAIFEATPGVDQIIVENDLLTVGNILIRSSNSSFEQVSLPTPDTSLEVRGLGDNDTITVNVLSLFDTGSRTLILDGGTGDDVIDVSVFGSGGFAWEATLRGDDGDDTLIGGLGDDTYEGGDGLDTIDLSGEKAYVGADITLTNTELAITRASGTETNTLSDIERAILIGDTVDSSGFDGQLIWLEGVPFWKEAGPGAATDGYVRLGGGTAAERVVTGAIQDVAAHPTDPDIIFVATVNGGVYRTKDGGDTWEALTSQFPSLSMSRITFDMDDPNTIYAGTGKTSSYRNEGGQAIGVLKSVDGGDTWSLIGDEFRGKRVTGIVAKGSTVLVTTDESPYESLWRSTNGGDSFTQISVQTAQASDGVDNDSDGLIDEVTLAGISINAAGDGYKVGDRVSFDAGGAARLKTVLVVTRIDETDADNHTGHVLSFNVVSGGEYNSADAPSSSATTAIDGSGTGLTVNIAFNRSMEPIRGPITDMVAEDVGGNLTVYVGVKGYGVFRSDDGGATWSDINRNLSTDRIAESTRVRLAVSKAGDQPVYAAFVDTQDGGEDRVSGLFRLTNPADGGSNWVEMDRPGQDDAATDPDESIHPGGQADKHFSMVADPNNANLVFVGGDTGPFVADVWTANLWRGDASQPSGSQWTSLVNDGAGDTSPHPDSRNMAFDSDNNIIEVDDGGIYKLTNPNDSGSREWVSLIGSGLSLMEFLSVAYDPVHDVIIGGAQDNGVVLQSTSDPNLWKTVLGGDGQAVAVAVDGSNTTLYFSSQRLGNFSRISNGDPGTKTGMGLEVDGTGFFDDTSIPDFEDLKSFYSSVAVNAVDPDKLMIGTHFIYESLPSSFDLEDLFSSTDSSVDFDLYGEPAGNSPPYRTAFQLDSLYIQSMIYGGYTLNGSGDRVGDAGITYAGGFQDGELYVRQTQDGSFQKTNFKTVVGGGPVDIVAHPDDWKQVFVVTEDAIWHGKLTEPAPADGNVDYQWTNLTGNLNNLTRTLKTIEIVQKDKGTLNDADDDTFVMLVGGLGGVFKTELDLDTLGSANPVWTEYGAGLPNQIVTDLHYDTTDKLLLAGTLGRGVWVVENADETLGDTSTLHVKGHATDPDTLTLQRNEDAPWMLDVFLNGETESAASFELSSIGNIDIEGEGGNDVIQVDRTNGPVFVNGSFHIDGGGGTNTFELVNAGTLSGSVVVNAGEARITNAEDPFGFTQSNTISFENVTAPTGEVATGTSAMSTGLDSFFDSTSGSAGEAMAGENVGGLSGGSMIAGLGGELFEFVNPTEDRAGVVINSTADGLTLIDTGTNLLKRFFEAGDNGFNIDDVLEEGPAALELALQALDPEGTVVSTGTTFDDISYDISLTRRLDGLVDLQVIGNALVEQLGITDLADALSDSIQFDGAVAFSADITLDLTFGIDPVDGFYIDVDSTPGAAELAISNIQIGGNATVTGRFGFLAVELSNIALELESGIGLKLDLPDPGTVAADNRITAGELSDLSVGFSIESPGTPQTPDATLSADLSVLAEIAGLNFTVFDTNISLEWGDIQDTSFNVNAGGPDASALLNFLKLDPQAFLDQLRDLKNQLSTAIGAFDDFDIPFLDVSLSEVLDFDTVFDSRILSALQLSPTSSFLTAQGLATALSASLTDLVASDEFENPADAALAEARNVLTTIEDLGFAYDAATGELTYNLSAQFGFDLSEPLNFGFDLEEGLAGLTASALANLDIGVQFNLTLGLDLDDLSFDPASLLDNFFIRDASITGSISASVDDFDALARLGFLNVEVVDGLAALNATLTLSLTDPGTNANDNRLDLSEIIDGIGDPTNFISLDIAGSADFQLPLAAPFLGITASPDTTIGVSISDLSDLSTLDVTLPSGLDFSEMFNFNNMDAGTMVGLLAQLTGWLDDFRRSDTFAGFDVPLVGPALDKVLAFADQFRDFLLFDDGDDGQDGSDRLITDINDAIATAGISDKVRAEADGDSIRLIAADSTIEAFSITAAGGNALGFGTSQSAAMDGTQLALTAASPAPADGKIGADVTFNVSIDGGSPTAVTVTAAATANNVGLGNDIVKLADANNAPTFFTVQEFALKVADILGLADVVEYDPADDTLTFNLDLSGAFGELELPVDFNFDLAPLLELESDSKILLSASGGLTLTLGVYLGDAPSSTLIDTATPLADINDGVEIDTAQTITATQDVSTIYGRLSGDATFKLSVDGGPAARVVVAAAATSTNSTVADLVADINAAIAAAVVDGSDPAVDANLESQVQAEADGNRIVLRALGGASTLVLTLSAGDPAANDLGFRNNQEAIVDGGILKIRGGKDVPGLVGRFSAPRSSPMLFFLKAGTFKPFRSSVWKGEGLP